MRTLLTSSEGDTSSGVKRPDFRRIRWLAILLPASSIGLFEFLRHQWLAAVLPEWLGAGWLGNVVGIVMITALVYVFVRFFANILQESALEVARAREEAAVVVERQRIAREMHDGVAQSLFYLSVKLREIDELMLAGESKEANSELRAARGEIRAAYRRVRAVIVDLREQAELEDFGEAVRRTVTELSERLGVRVTCEVARRVTLPATSRQHVLAIIQEALTNAQRHGHAQRARVRLFSTGGEAEIEVSDDGVGFDPDAVLREGGYGLAIMEERAQMAGGRLDLYSALGCGTCVTVHLPGADA